MKIVITGATGFIGDYLIQYLLTQSYTLHVTSVSIDKAQQKDWFSKVNYHPFQIGDQMNEDSLMFFGNTDLIIHLAWEGLNDFKSVSHTDEHLNAQKKFVDQLASLNVKRLVCIGTCLEYGFQEGELHEAMEIHPSISYAIAKDSLRQYIESLSSSFVAGICWLRLFYMYGEGQSEKSFFPQLKKAIKENRTYFDMSLGEQERDYLPVEKVSEYIARISLNKQAFGIINCCSGKPIKLRKLAEYFIAEENSSIQLNLGVYPYLDYEPMSFWGNNDKLKKILHEKL
jgi:nucleoside-diphosphate-sugar epimerase